MEIGLLKVASEKHFQERSVELQIPREIRVGMTKERGDASIESGYWREGVFITLGGRRFSVRTEKKPANGRRQAA
jgi:hypothetical protein